MCVETKGFMSERVVYTSLSLYFQMAYYSLSTPLVLLRTLHAVSFTLLTST